MRLSTINKSTIDKMHLYSGENKQTIRSFFESLIFIIVLDYLEGESTNIPFLGNITVKYAGDKIVNGKKEADVNITIDSENVLIRNIGQIVDGEESEIEKLIKIRIREALRSYVA